MTFFCKQIIILLLDLQKNTIIYKKEVNMKKLLLITIIAAASQLGCFAAISVDQTTNAQFLRNQGFSAQTTDAVNVSKARAVGQEYYTKDEENFRNSNKFVRFFRKLYIYTDPASEDYSFYHHDTDTTPSYQDL